MDEEAIRLAERLEAQARAIRMEAHVNRPLPDVWRVGQRVRYIRDIQWGPEKGQVGVIVELREGRRRVPAHQYQVFWTRVEGGGPGVYWTTPDDVELADEVMEDEKCTFRTGRH